MLLPYNVDSIVHFVSLSLLSCCLIPGTYQRLNDFLVHAGRLLKERFGQTCNRKQQTKPTRQRLSAGVCVCVRQPLPTPLPLNTASHGLFVLALFPAAWCFRLPRVLRAWVATTRGGTFVVGVARRTSVETPKAEKNPTRRMPHPVALCRYRRNRHRNSIFVVASQQWTHPTLDTFVHSRFGFGSRLGTTYMPRIGN